MTFGEWFAQNHGRRGGKRAFCRKWNLTHEVLVKAIEAKPVSPESAEIFERATGGAFPRASFVWPPQAPAQKRKRVRAA